jgi:hypothetical protein
LPLFFSSKLTLQLRIPHRAWGARRTHLSATGPPAPPRAQTGRPASPRPAGKRRPPQVESDPDAASKVAWKGHLRGRPPGWAVCFSGASGPCFAGSQARSAGACVRRFPRRGKAATHPKKEGPLEFQNAAKRAAERVKKKFVFCFNLWRSGMGVASLRGAPLGRIRWGGRVPTALPWARRMVPVGADALGCAGSPWGCCELEEGCPLGVCVRGPKSVVGVPGVRVPWRGFLRWGAGPAQWVHLYVVPAFHVGGPFPAHRRCISLVSPRQRRGETGPPRGQPCRGVPNASFPPWVPSACLSHGGPPFARASARAGGRGPCGLRCRR